MMRRGLFKMIGTRPYLFFIIFYLFYFNAVTAQTIPVLQAELKLLRFAKWWCEIISM
jgi:hypothetical protein